jgi:predicted ArsR family transcriptional regulator
MSKTIEQLFFESLNEKQKRHYAALKADELGYFGVHQVAEKLGIHPHTIRVGQKELGEIAKTGEISTRIRQVGGGRKKTSK